MINIKKIDINKLSSNGTYFDPDVPIMFKLTDEDIIEVRKEYGEHLCPDRVVIEKSPGFNITREDFRKAYDNRGKNYSLQRTKGKRRVLTPKEKFLLALKHSKYKLAAMGISVAIISSAVISFNPSKVNAPEVEYVPTHNVASNIDTTEIPEIDIEALMGPQQIQEQEVTTEVEVDPEEQLRLEIEQQRKDIIRSGCSVYGLNFETVYNKICELTDNFSNEAFLNGSIPGVQCKSYDVVTDNEAELFYLACRHFFQIPDDFGLSKDSLFNNVEEYVDTKSYEECIAYYGSVFGDENLRNTCFGIFRSETGGDSDLLIYSNNYGGITSTSGGFAKYGNKDQGAIDLFATVKYSYYNKGMTTPEAMQEIYAPSFENDGPWWINTVNDYKSRANDFLGSMDEELAMRR